MKKIELCQNLLFTPANHLEQFEKAGNLPFADMVCFDLEDAISIQGKEEARQILFSYFNQKKEYPSNHSILLSVRINSIKTAFGLEDISAFLKNDFVPGIFLLPKIESFEEVEIYNSLFSGEFQNVDFLVLIETALGLEKAFEIAKHSRVVGLVYGGIDFANDIGANLDIKNSMTFRSRIIQAAKASHKLAWDVPFLDFKNEKGLIEEIKVIKNLGFDAKIAIHPNQLKTIKNVLKPTEKEIQEAIEIIKAYEKANGSVCEYQGKMVDVPVVKRCQRVLEKMKNK
ncbi:HpcH/HpaI aldolase/citrate lyase family protein [Aureivirga sp. CE67]|uniref:HpcH/HpaI aldolase/citrate lyase family protein n=1 Tax=Aureivirga sp. CE67 TaxID=1788983 RepID=UPI0018CBA2FA|nr:CoA ester lyase [Aureivirga sp. CE67]